MKKIDESRLTFCFDDSWNVVKFDDCRFYRDKFGKQPGGKGVDIFTESENSIQFIEVKNCLGYERENLWRAGRGIRKGHEDTFDVETAKKVAMSISCMYGAFTQKQCVETAETLIPFFSAMTSTKIPPNKKVIRVILFLEGEFGIGKDEKKKIMNEIQYKLKQHLSWLQCKVTVVDSNTVRDRYFTVEKASG